MEGRGRVVGEYILGPKIGSGSFSVVWRGTHRQQGVEVAVKEIDKKQLSSKVRDSLLTEVTILREVSHPNIVRLHQAIQTEDKIYLILEYCTGGDLAAYIHRNGRVSEGIARHFMRHLAFGLQVLKEKNLIHRDLKPQNLLLSTRDETPVLKIGDFGFARYLMPEGLADTLCGSPLYMAPEIILNKKYDAKADLWSVGAILFQLVTGKPPFDGNTQFQLFQNVLASEDLQFPRDTLADLHPDCIDLCRSLLRRDPEKRLTFEEFFSHKFMTTLSPSGSTLDFTQDTVDDSLEKPIDGSPSNSSYAASMRTGNMDQGLSRISTLKASMRTGNMDQGVSSASTLKVYDSLESIEREYVLVPTHFASMETSSSSLEMSSRDYPMTKLLSYTQKNLSKGSARLMQSGELVISAVCGVESIGRRECAPSSGSRASSRSDIPESSSLNPSHRLQFLYQYIYGLTELAREKLHAGLHLESFSIELVALAVWKEALRVCNSWITSTTEANPLSIFPAEDCPSQKSEHLPLNLVERLDFKRPSSVCSWVEQGFIVACDRAEKISNNFHGMADNVEMPDAMEMLFQTALSAGKSGAVDELMGHRSGAVASYSKAITLLTFILVEAPSLPLSPPFSLSPADQQRIHRYIINLRAHLNQAQVVEQDFKQTNDSPSK